MKKELIKALEACGYIELETLFLQGTLNPEEGYPKEFVTFWTNYADDGTHFDNETTSHDWGFTVILYSDDPEIVNTKPDEIRAVLKAAGFTPQGKGQDVPSDNASFTGWAMDFVKTEYKER